MFGISQPKFNFGNIAPSYCGGTSTSTVRNDSSDLSLSDIIDAFNELFPVIEVWRGDPAHRFNFTESLPSKPRIEESTMLKPDKAYIVAGFGVVAGLSVFKLLSSQGYRAVWVSEPPEFLM